MARDLTPNQQRFVDEYLVDLNATQAAIRAGYSAKTAESQGSTLLRNPKVAALVDARKAKRADKVEVKADEVLRELKTFGHADPAEMFDASGALLPIKKMPEHVRRSIASFEVEELWGSDGDGGKEPIGQVKKIKLWNKPQGLELLGKHIGLFPTKIDASGKLDVNVNVNVKLDYTLLSIEEHRTLVALLEKATPKVP